MGAPFEPARPEGMPLSPIARAYLESLLCGDRRAAKRVLRRALRLGVSAGGLFCAVFVPVKREVARRCAEGRLSTAVGQYVECAVDAAVEEVLASPPSSLFGSRRAGRVCPAVSTYEGMRRAAHGEAGARPPRSR